MTQPPPHPPHGGELPPEAPRQRPPQIWDTRYDQRDPSTVPASPITAPQGGPAGFGPAPGAFGPATPGTSDAAGAQGSGGGQGSGGTQGSGGGGKRRKALIIGLGLLLVAGAGTGGWLLWGRGGNDSPKPKGPPQAVAAKLDWVAALPEEDKKESHPLGPLWFAKDKVAVTTSRAVTAYDGKTGKVAWTIPAPDGGYTCKSSAKPADGVAAVIHGKGPYDCNMVMAVDLARGRVLWSKELTNDKGLSSSASSADITIGQGVISVADGGDPKVFAIADGSRRKPHDYGCQERGSFTDGSGRLTIAQCQAFGRIYVMNVDPRTGNENWIWKVPDGIKVKNVLSVKPAVLVVGRENDNDPSDLASLDENGRLKTLISVSAGPYDLSDCTFGELASCRMAVVDGNTVYLSTAGKEYTNDGANPNAVVAIDLTTGKQRWSTTLSGNRSNRPVTMRDGRLLVYQQATKDESGKLLSLDPADGKAADFMRLPQESNEREYDIARRGIAYFHDDHFYVAVMEGMTGSTMMMAFH
ncbi:outer membrane protein assembly factor BamB family protein [Streptomyces hesseae]|uniref:PQQ-binding-like beta-propeller repeat protein n=1 Tax=Streptomyces hesseae TaxID=3075519 RepID=A0ABU2SUD4_9ACTN|nr:PQQ-binding-like beta-propeller repeat protein [Streptomyces sp. DSM 40473]MDT0452619.1 PQQ-binding-like beta-propeller repeat protein [Streptomyces sp. DSM 40473]